MNKTKHKETKHKETKQKIQPSTNFLHGYTDIYEVGNINLQEKANA